MPRRSGRTRSNTASIVGTVLAVALAVASPSGATSAASPTPALRAVHFSGSFVPQQITAAAGSLWVMGSRSPSTFTDCALERFDPSTLDAEPFSLPQCASDIASGDGRVYLLVNNVQPNTNTRDYQIEVFDPATHSAEVLPPVVLQNIGSAVAHTDLSFGEGSLWLYGYSLGAKDEVVQISPETGDVERTIDDAPAIGGLYPTVVANAAGVWLGGGPGGPAQLEWVRAGTGDSTNVSLVTGGRSGSILWLSAAGGRIWAGVAKYGGAPGTTTVTTRLVALNDEGHVAVHSPWQALGLFPVVATPDGHLWDVEYPVHCAGAAHLLEINSATGVSRRASDLAAPPAACDDEDAGSELAAVGRAVFALFPTGAAGGAVLYRATT